MLRKSSLGLTFAISALLTARFGMGAASPIAVTSAADYQLRVAPASIASLFGSGMASGVFVAGFTNGQLPTGLGGVSVSINGELSPLIYVSPTQINFVVPADAAQGTATVSVSSSALASPLTGTTNVQLTGAGIFTIPCFRMDRAAAENGVTGALEPFQAATPQNAGADKQTRLAFYGTGFRYAGSQDSSRSSANATSSVSATMKDAKGNHYSLPVEYAGPQPTMAGLDQVNVVLPPQSDSLGLVSVQFVVNGVTTQPVSVQMSAIPDVNVSAPALNVSTAAGSGPAGYSGDTQAALSAKLNQPASVAFGPDHSLYIADTGNHVVRRVTPDGVIHTFAGNGVAGYSGDDGPATSAEMRSPSDLAVDSSGALYIADTADNRIRKVDAQGNVTTAAGTGIAGLQGDGGPAVTASLNAPSGLAINPQGSILIADTGNNVIRQITGDGLISTFTDGGTTKLNRPTDVTVGADGTVFIADSQNYQIRRIVPGLVNDAAAGTGKSGSTGSSCAATAASFGAPVHLTTDLLGDVIVSDTANNRIRLINSNCYIVDIAGTGTAGAAGDGGAALSANLNTPSGVAVDQTGDIYVADTSNQRIQRLSSTSGSMAAFVAFNPSIVTAGFPVTAYLHLPSAVADPVTFNISSSIPISGLPATVTVPGGQSTVPIMFAAPPASGNVPVTITATNGGQSASGVFTDMPSIAISISSLGLNPSSATGGQPVTGTVNLAGPAPEGDATVSLSSNNPVAPVAASVAIPAGQTSAQFLIPTSPVTQPVSVSISAGVDGKTATASLSLAPGQSSSGPGQATIGSITLSPTSITGGQPVTGLITLAAPAPSNGVLVNLSSNSPTATVPATINVPAGQTTATFPVNTTATSTPTTATITAESANTLTAALNVDAANNGSTLATIGSLSIAPATVTGGSPVTGTVTLAAPAPAGGVTVSLSSTSPSATVPGRVTVPAGQTTVTFPVATTPGTTPTTATITAKSANTETAVVTVNPASAGGAQGTIGSVTLNPTTVTGGQPVTGTVTLTAPAPSGGVSVALSSNSPSAAVPASITVPTGQTTATFPVTTTAGSAATTATITAKSANTQTANLTVNPAGSGGSSVTIGSVSVNPTTVTGGTPVGGTVTLASPAPSNGATVALASNSPSAAVPATVTIPAGQTAASFTVTTSPAASNTTATISATSGSSTQSASLQINAPCPSALTLSASITNLLNGSGLLSGTVTLDGPAPQGGESVSLLSGNANLGNVLVPGGQTSAPVSLNLADLSTLLGSTVTALTDGCPAIDVTIQTP